MAKLIFRSGRELPVLACGFSSFGTIHIDCELPFSEAAALFSDPENIAEFTYVYEAELKERELTQLRETVNCDMAVSISSPFNGWLVDDRTITAVLHGTHRPSASQEEYA